MTAVQYLEKGLHDTSGSAIAISIKVRAVVSRVIAPWLGALGR